MGYPVSEQLANEYRKSNVRIFSQLREISTEAKRNSRILREILVRLQWEPVATKPGEQPSETPDTVIKASSVYKRDQIGNLLCAAQSTLSLALSGDSEDDTVSGLFIPPIGSNVPISDSQTYHRGSGKREADPVDPNFTKSFKTTIVVESLAAILEARVRSRTLPRIAKFRKGFVKVVQPGNSGNYISMILGSLTPLLDVVLSPVSALSV